MSLGESCASGFLDRQATMGHIFEQEELILTCQREKRDGRRVVFTQGCFDLLHPGHVRFLEEARKLGDFLVVAVYSDEGARRLKGADRPIIPQQERAEVLAALESVDTVVILDQPAPRELIARLLLNVLVQDKDSLPDQLVGREEVEAAGGRVVSIPSVEGYSTSRILRAIRESRKSAPSCH
jgi:rfaE bifunctional protein nucleotidyltransferase chain/domain